MSASIAARRASIASTVALGSGDAVGFGFGGLGFGQFVEKRLEPFSSGGEFRRAQHGFQRAEFGELRGGGMRRNTENRAFGVFDGAVEVVDFQFGVFQIWNENHVDLSELDLKRNFMFGDELVEGGADDVCPAIQGWGVRRPGKSDHEVAKLSYGGRMRQIDRRS